ncbi:MAG TPA: YolD-like family protein [Lachnospiraceae bacterium]|nr:YolD-like family protein [Lachnospiraceae bacterium]
MASRPRKPMSAINRAKQFLPFQAVKGLDEALEQKERELYRVEKAQLSEEQIAEITECIRTLKKKQSVAVTYYSDGQYQTLTGEYGGYQEAAANIVVAEVWIPVAELYTIKRL